LGFDFLIMYSGRSGGFSMGKLFFFCLFVAAVPWTQAQARGGHAVIVASSGHSGAVSVAPTVHTGTPTTVHADTSTIVHVPQVNMNAGNMNAGNANSFRSNRLYDPLNNNMLLNPPGQQISPLPAPKPSVAPMNPLGTTVQTQTRAAVNGYTVPQVRQVQAALHRLGYYNGPVDGDFGLSTQTALESYQIHAGGAVTGTLTMGVLSSLGVNGSK
jgi:Putative peptidoglycan binding domain